MQQEQIERFCGEGSPPASEGAPISCGGGNACRAAGSGQMCGAEGAGRGNRAGWWNLQNRTIRCELIALILLVAVAAVVFESGVFVLYQRHLLHTEPLSEANTVADGLITNTASSLASNDRAAASRWLAALVIEQHVAAARLYDTGGNVFAEYRRAGYAGGVPKPPEGADSEHFAGHALTLSRGIAASGKSAGSMVLVYDLTSFQTRLRERYRIGLWVLFISVVVRVMVVMRLTRMVTDPLAYLSNIARTISERHDYSLRAEGRRGGEIGQLTDAFNEMLAQIERQEKAREAAESHRRETEERYLLAARGSNDGIWDWTLASGRIYFSPRLNGILGDPEAERWGSPQELFARIHPADGARIHAEFAAFNRGSTAAFESECRIRHSSGAYIWVLARGTAVRDESGRVVRTAGSLSDITRRKLTDAVTGLPNRLYFVEELERSLESAKRDASHLAVLFLDLDHFRLLTDTLGHAASEELLAQVAGRLRSMMRVAGREVMVARSGEGEFGVLLTGLREAQEAANVARRTLELLREPFYIEGQRFSAGACIGIAIGSPAERPEDLLRNAETAKYNASTKGNSEFAIFNPGMRDRAVARLEIVTGLRRAVEAGELRLRYQPLVCLRSRRIIGFESLVRWQHPERGLMRPGEFIPIAEESDLILSVGEWVLREACRQMAEWKQRLAPGSPLNIGVNVAARQMRDAGFAELVRRVLDETGMDARCLRLEVTESSLAADSGQIQATLQALRQMHISLVIDDFGTGYSSLSSLRRLPFNILKIDRSFIRDLGAGDGSPDIVRAIIQLARSFKLKVVAEGVETAEQLTRVAALGCDLVQGFYFGRPASAEQTEALIRDRDAIHPAFPYGTERDYFADEPQESAAQPLWAAAERHN